jgi:hypothetical protein
MSSLIDQLQEEALDPSTSIADLLRKAKVVAMKLDRREAIAWVEHELNGYPSGVDVPDYRVIRGQPRYCISFRGWLPLMISDEEIQAGLSKLPNGSPISQLEALKDGEGELHMPYSVSIIASIQQMVGIPVQSAALWCGRNTVSAILDVVRTRVLDWAVELEKAGVRGEGRLSFSKRDREAAASVTYNINVGGSVTGNVGSMDGHATVNATHIGPEAVHTLTTLAEQIQQSARHMGLAEEERTTLEQNATELAAEAKRAPPDRRALGKILGSIRAIAENAAGSLLASGILHALANPAVKSLLP